MRPRLILPEIETKRLYLREIKRSDAKDIFDYAKDPRVGPQAGWEPHTSIDETYTYINYAIKKRDYGQPGVFAIVHKDNGNVIGTIEIHSYQDFKGEIGFVLHPNYWNQGLITEAAKAVIIYGMEILNLKRLQYCHFKDNHASKRVCEKLGFQFEGILRDKFLRYDGVLLDDVTYSITATDYYNDNIPWIRDYKKDVMIDY